MINLRQVRSLLAVVELGSVNRAAERLCLAPSSVSAQLRELAGFLQVELFDTAGRGLVLSTAGRQLLPGFQRLIALNDEITAKAVALTTEPVGELRLYAPSSMCIYRLPKLIEGLQIAAPGVELQLQHDPFDYWAAMADRSIDAAIIVVDKAAPGIDARRWQQQALALEEVIYVAHPKRVQARAFDVTQLMQHALITTEPECSYRRAAEAHFKQHGIQLAPRQAFSNVEVVRRCLLTNMGIGLLPRCVVAADIDSGSLAEQAVKGAPYQFESVLVWPREAAVSPRLDALIQLIRAHFIA